MVLQRLVNADNISYDGLYDALSYMLELMKRFTLVSKTTDYGTEGLPPSLCRDRNLLFHTISISGVEIK